MLSLLHTETREGKTMDARRLLAAVFAALATAVLAPAAQAACRDCGTVVNLKKVEHAGESGGGGAILGGIAGGVLGHQLGNGRGNTAATVVGAAGGAYAGNEIEKNRNKAVSYEVIVEMEDGARRTFSYHEPTDFRMGDRVRIVDHKLRHR
jgi:outer membrane lipoprotein SlyB